MTLAQDLQAVREALTYSNRHLRPEFYESLSIPAEAALARIESEVARLERIEEAARAWAGNLTFETTRDLLAAVAAEEGGDREAR